MLSQKQKFEGNTIFSLSLGLGALFLFSNTASAELWKFQPDITLEERYDDNLRLTTSPHDSVLVSRLRGVLAFSRLTETGGVIGRIRAVANHYSGDDQIENNTTNILFTLNANQKSELAEWGAGLFYKKDTTIKSIDTSLDINPDSPAEEPPVLDDGTDLGLVEVDIRRNTLRVDPYWKLQLSERSSVNAFYRLTDVTFDNNVANSGLYDYDSHEVGVGFSHLLTERDTVFVAVAGSKYKAPDNNNNKVDSYELTAGYMRELSETTRGKVEVGVNKTEQTSLVSSNDDTGSIFRAEIVHKSEQSRYILVLSHDTQPSGVGNLTELSQLGFRIKHKFSTRLDGLVRMRYHQRKSINDTASAKNHYASIEPSLRWKLTRAWTVGGGVNYRKGKRSTNIDTADATAVFLSIGYSEPFTSD